MQIPAPFDYVRATTVENALELLARHGPESRVVAGGHSLLPMMKLRLSRPEWLIDINDLFELDFILRDGGGPAHRRPDPPHARCWNRTNSPGCSRSSGTPNRSSPTRWSATAGTIGGSLCQADPAEDLSTVCDVLGAVAVVRGPGGERTLAMQDFHRGPYQTAVGQDELLCEVRIADPAPLVQRLREGGAARGRLGRRGRWRGGDARRRTAASPTPPSG